ncbi:MAG TPA: oxidoreductase-like domain-containing protein [Dokdonella sp.]
MAPPDDPEPQPPPEPDAADCCGEGCVNCIFDLHDAALERYRADLAAWRTRQCERAAAADMHPSPGGGGNQAEGR